MELMKLEKHHPNQHVNSGFVPEENGQMFNSEEHSGEEEEDADSKEHTRCLEEKTIAFYNWRSGHKEQMKRVTKLVLAAGVLALVIAACVVNFSKGFILLAILTHVIPFSVCAWVWKRYGPCLREMCARRKMGRKTKLWIKWIVLSLLPLPIVVLVAVDTFLYGTGALISFCGLLLLIFIMLLFSKHPFRWPWNTLIVGVSLQFYFAAVFTRVAAGKHFLKIVGNATEIFMSFSNSGAEFVFGPNYADHLFVFKVMPVLVFISTVISILQHIGLLSRIIRNLGYCGIYVMGTSPAESMAAAGNIFLGQAESVLLIRPYVNKLTCSEIHAVMTGGFASIDGSVLGAFMAYGVDPTHLLIASVMSAPASLAVAKVFWPETEKTQVTTSEDIQIDNGNSSSVIEAACHGASSSVEVVANIVVNIISALALLTMVDSTLSWIGGIFDYPEFSFTDSFIVADLIGKKTFINEFVAYQKLSEYISRRKAGGPEYVGGLKQYISERSETIATYALCGFSNISSLAMLLGVFAALAPERRADVSSCGVRALIAGCVSCFMSACIAGILFGPDVQCPDFLNAAFNSSTPVSNSTQLLSCCSQLYNSVSWQQEGNVTLGAEFSLDSLRSCCELTPPTHFNCTL